jgi:hypothetical protein
MMKKITVPNIKIHTGRKNNTSSRQKAGDSV